jgi:probable HAF family extracellular repeat protein
VLSTATGINDNQQIVGAGYHNGLYRPFLWQVGGGVITDLGALAAARAVNQAGQVVGGTRLAPYLWAGGTTTILPTWPGTPSGNTQAVALNDASQVQVVGYCQDFTDVVPGFGGALLWQDGQAINLTSRIPKSAKWSLWYAYGINDAGRIVGSGSNGSGLQHAFLLTPPTTRAADQGVPAQVAASTSHATVAPSTGAVSTAVASALTASSVPTLPFDKPPAPLAAGTDSAGPVTLTRSTTVIAQVRGRTGDDDLTLNIYGISDSDELRALIEGGSGFNAPEI